KEQLPKKERYQTVYAREKGSAGAPTAGLHFTRELSNDIQQRGVEIAFITLHVGLGTFRPVNVDHIEDHQMHAEFYHMSKETADARTNAKHNHRRIISVGTPPARTIETIVGDHNGTLVEA